MAIGFLVGFKPVKQPLFLVTKIHSFFLLVVYRFPTNTINWKYSLFLLILSLTQKQYKLYWTFTINLSFWLLILKLFLFTVNLLYIINPRLTLTHSHQFIYFFLFVQFSFSFYFFIFTRNITNVLFNLGQCQLIAILGERDKNSYLKLSLFQLFHCFTYKIILWIIEKCWYEKPLNQLNFLSNENSYCYIYSMFFFIIINGCTFFLGNLKIKKLFYKCILWVIKRNLFKFIPLCINLLYSSNYML